MNKEQALRKLALGYKVRHKQWGGGTYLLELKELNG